jgi:hypothetical protein
MREKAIEEQEPSQAETQQSGRLALAECGKNLWAHWSFTGLHVRDKPGLSGPSG